MEHNFKTTAKTLLEFCNVEPFRALELEHFYYNNNAKTVLDEIKLGAEFCKTTEELIFYLIHVLEDFFDNRKEDQPADLTHWQTMIDPDAADPIGTLKLSSNEAMEVYKFFKNVTGDAKQIIKAATTKLDKIEKFILVMYLLGDWQGATREKHRPYTKPLRNISHEQHN